VQLSLAIDTLKILHAVHDRLRARKDDGIGGLIVVFHIALMELVERGHYIGFPMAAGPSEGRLMRRYRPRPPSQP